MRITATQPPIRWCSNGAADTVPALDSLVLPPVIDPRESWEQIPSEPSDDGVDFEPVEHIVVNDATLKYHDAHAADETDNGLFPQSLFQSFGRTWATSCHRSPGRNPSLVTLDIDSKPDERLSACDICFPPMRAEDGDRCRHICGWFLGSGRCARRCVRGCLPNDAAVTAHCHHACEPCGRDDPAHLGDSADSDASSAKLPGDDAGTATPHEASPVACDGGECGSLVRAASVEPSQL